MSFLPDVKIAVGKSKKIGFITILINSRKGTTLIKINESEFKGPYSIKDIREINVYSNEEVIYKTSKGLMPMVLGGTLFGSLGAIAGSVSASKTSKLKIKESYKLVMSFDDITFPSFVVTFKNENLAHTIINTYEIIRKKITDFKDEKLDVVESVDSSDIYTQLINLEKLYKQGIIDEKTYLEKKDKFIQKL